MHQANYHSPALDSVALAKLTYIGITLTPKCGDVAFYPLPGEKHGADMFQQRQAGVECVLRRLPIRMGVGSVALAS